MLGIFQFYLLSVYATIYSKSMKIGIDISLLCISQTGIGQYRYNLVNALIRERPEDEFYLYGFNYRLNEKIDELEFVNSSGHRHGRNWKIDLKRFPNRAASLWWNYFRGPKLESVVEECDCYHLSETGFQPSAKSVVATIHDLTIEKFPELHLKENRLFSEQRHRRLAESDAKIIAVSENTKNDFVEFYGVDPGRIEVVYHGKDEMYRPIEDEGMIDSVKSKYGIEGPYILYLGTIEPRKNLERLVEAFNELKKVSRIPHSLVLAGKKGWFYEGLIRKIREFGLEGDVIFTDFVEEREKPLLINGAEVFVYPSLYEGFGLPVLEAMACGVPVVTSDVSAIPEVTGEKGALLVDPLKSDEIGAGIWKILSDSGGAGALGRAGMERAAEFSWEKCAGETLGVYATALG